MPKSSPLRFANTPEIPAAESRMTSITMFSVTLDSPVPGESLPPLFGGNGNDIIAEARSGEVNAVLVGRAFYLFNLCLFQILQLLVIKCNKVIDLVIVLVPILRHIGGISERHIDSVSELEPIAVITGKRDVIGKQTGFVFFESLVRLGYRVVKSGIGRSRIYAEFEIFLLDLFAQFKRVLTGLTHFLRVKVLGGSEVMVPETSSTGISPSASPGAAGALEFSTMFVVP